MAKKQTDTAIDLRAELKKRVKLMQEEVLALEKRLPECVNERAQLWQYYKGCIAQAEADMAYLKALLDA